MFGNRGHAWKLGAALALLALLGVHAARRGQGINPALWRCVVQPERWENTTLWLPAARVLSVGASDFEVASGDSKIRVVGRSPAPVGDLVTVRGVFRAEGPRLEMIRGRALADDLSRRRLLMEIVSVVVVLAVFANFARHFLFRPRQLQVERAD